MFLPLCVWANVQMLTLSKTVVDDFLRNFLMVGNVSIISNHPISVLIRIVIQIQEFLTEFTTAE